MCLPICLFTPSQGDTAGPAGTGQDQGEVQGQQQGGGEGGEQLQREAQLRQLTAVLDALEAMAAQGEEVDQAVSYSCTNSSLYLPSNCLLCAVCALVTAFVTSCKGSPCGTCLVTGLSPAG